MSKLVPESSDPEYFQCPAPDLRKTKFPKGKKSVEVQFSVSYRYNGGTIVDDKWYRGFFVPPPILPEGCKLVGLGVGYQLNAHPPYATQLLVKE